MPDPPVPELARLMAEKGESLRRYVRNEARSALAAEVRDGKVPAISKRLRPAMADAILQGRFSELPPEVREAINSRLASGPQGWWTQGPLAVFNEVLASDRKGWHPGALVAFWEHLEREPHLSDDWETLRALRDLAKRESNFERMKTVLSPLQPSLRDLAERESNFEAHRPAAHEVNVLLAATSPKAERIPRRTYIGTWAFFLGGLMVILLIPLAFYQKMTTPPLRPGERTAIIIAAMGDRDTQEELKEERRSVLDRRANVAQDPSYDPASKQAVAVLLDRKLKEIDSFLGHEADRSGEPIKQLLSKIDAAIELLRTEVADPTRSVYSPIAVIEGPKDPVLIEVQAESYRRMREEFEAERRSVLARRANLDGDSRYAPAPRHAVTVLLDRKLKKIEEFLRYPPGAIDTGWRGTELRELLSTIDAAIKLLGRE